MSRRPTKPAAATTSLLCVLLLGGPLSFGVVACSGGGGEEGTAQTTAPAQAVAPALIADAWQVRMADDQARAPFEAHAGWAHLFQHDHHAALASFAADPGDGRGLARTHLELAALYRQAALVAGRSGVYTYGEARVDEDPASVDYLVAVGDFLEGKTREGELALTALGKAGPAPLQAAAEDWRAWVQAGATWPPDASLTHIPGQPGVVTPGTNPEVGELPHYRLVEQSAEARAVEVGDPTTLYLLARWHEAAARQSSPGDAAIVDLYLAPWRLPAEAVPSANAPPGAPAAVPHAVPEGWLFGGFYLTADDLSFVSQATTDGVTAVDTWKDRSPLAAAVAPAITDGKVVPDRMLDQAAWLGQQVQAAMAVKSGSPEAFHEPFSKLATVAALRAAMIVADANGQYRDAGVLRINALDRSVDAAADPVFLASVAAWDAGNKNALRAQELVHRLDRRYPAILAARYALDALNVRTSRNAAPVAPVH